MTTMEWIRHKNVLCNCKLRRFQVTLSVHRKYAREIEEKLFLVEVLGMALLKGEV